MEVSVQALEDGGCFSSRSPPRLKKARPSDRIKSGIIPMTGDDGEAATAAIGEAVRLFSGKPGQYHTAEAYRRYPCGRSVSSLGRKDNKVIPRIYFSKAVPSSEGVAPTHKQQLRCDCEARFNFGTGPMAADEENRIIHSWTAEMEGLAKKAWSSMKKHPVHGRLCRRENKENEFNHVSVHFHRGNTVLPPHEDRRRNGRNSMRRNTAVAVLTVGGPRVLSFYRRYATGNRKITETEPCYQFALTEGTLFVLHPHDEEGRCRRDMYGRRQKNAVFAHGITTPADKDFFSVAFVFRCLDTTAVVDRTTDRVVPPPAMTETEKKRRKQREALRKVDQKENSKLNKQVEEVQSEWIRLMGARGWLS